jgi:hypothetical protein
LLLPLLLAGCTTTAPEASPAPPAPSPTKPFEPASSPTPPLPPTASPTRALQESCTTKDCFITAAGACKDTTLTLTEEAGTFTYTATMDCVFTKTLVTAHPDEMQEMKTLLQGKSLTCRYTKGAFDERWVKTLVFGTERCEGNLREVLAQLIAFA